MTAVFVPAGVLGLALTMLVAHARTWRRARARRLSAADFMFQEGQFRRRMQASSLLALVAPTMLVGVRVPAHESPKIFMALWLVVALATCWVAWLAFLDALASARHFHRLSRERSIDRARLRSELDRLIAQTRVSRAVADIAPSEKRQD
jgi:hypothetical protein